MTDVPVRLSDTQTGVLRVFAGARVPPRSFLGSYGPLLEQGLIERVENHRYQITQFGRRVVARLNGQHEEDVNSDRRVR